MDLIGVGGWGVCGRVYGWGIIFGILIGLHIWGRILGWGLVHEGRINGILLYFLIKSSIASSLFLSKLIFK